MAVQFQVNISISAGADFTQEYSVNDPNLAPVDITGYKFFAKLAKHPTSIDAMTSTSGTPVYNYVTFDTSIVDGKKGIYSISLGSAKTSLLAEGKYVYSVVVQNTSGEKSPAIEGISFVDVAFGALS